MGEETPTPPAASSAPDIPVHLDVSSLPDETKVVSPHTLRNRMRKKKGVRKPLEAKQSPYSDIPTLTNRGCNYALAFTLYVNGIPLTTIAKDLGISSTVLAQRATAERWKNLTHYAWERLYKKQDERRQLEPIPKAESDKMLEKKIQRIDQNRGQVIELASVLREKLMAVAKGIDQVPVEAMGDAEVLADMTRSIASLAKAAKDIAEMTMIAHGDENVIRHLGQGFNTKQGNSGPAIIINIPNALANSRRKMISVEKVIEASGGEIRQLGTHGDASAH